MEGWMAIGLVGLAAMAYAPVHRMLRKRDPLAVFFLGLTLFLGGVTKLAFDVHEQCENSPCNHTLILTALVLVTVASGVAAVAVSSKPAVRPDKPPKRPGPREE
jgi:protein-S-isoprenylcysteine O-methyltransferase Ste14